MSMCSGCLSSPTVTPPIELDVTFAWEAPTTGGPVENYLVEVSVGGGPFFLMTTTEVEEVLLAFPRWTAIVVRVAGRNENGQGPYSLPSTRHVVGDRNIETLDIEESIP